MKNDNVLNVFLSVKYDDYICTDGLFRSKISWISICDETSDVKTYFNKSLKDDLKTLWKADLSRCNCIHDKILRLPFGYTFRFSLSKENPRYYNRYSLNWIYKKMKRLYNSDKYYNDGVILSSCDADLQTIHKDADLNLFSKLFDTYGFYEYDLSSIIGKFANTDSSLYTGINIYTNEIKGNPYMPFYYDYLENKDCFSSSPTVKKISKIGDLDLSIEIDDTESYCKMMRNEFLQLKG